MKKLLIVDTMHIPELKEETVEGTAITIVHTCQEAWELIKSSYNFDSQSWDDQHPHAPTPVQTPHHLRAQARRQAQLSCRLPYWDAILFYLNNSDSDLCSAIGCSTIATLSGCRYIRILEFSNTSFGWFPAESIEHGFKIQFENHEFRVSKKWRPIRGWIKELHTLLLHTEGYDGMLFKGTHPMPQPNGTITITAEEFFNKVWPGLPWQK